MDAQLGNRQPLWDALDGVDLSQRPGKGPQRAGAPAALPFASARDSTMMSSTEMPSARRMVFLESSSTGPRLAASRPLREATVRVLSWGDLFGTSVFTDFEPLAAASAPRGATRSSGGSGSPAHPR